METLPRDEFDFRVETGDGLVESATTSPIEKALLVKRWQAAQWQV